MTKVIHAERVRTYDLFAVFRFAVCAPFCDAKRRRNGGQISMLPEVM